MGMQELIVTVVEKHAQNRPPVTGANVIVDECLKHPLIEALLLDLMRRRTIGAADFFNWQLRQLSDGSHHVTGGSRPKVMPTGLEWGVPVKHWSLPDERVAEFVVVHFAGADNVVFLSANTRLNLGG